MATSTVTAVEIVRVDDPLNVTERAAIAGFLAGYTGNTLTQLHDRPEAVRRVAHDQRRAPVGRAPRAS